MCGRLPFLVLLVCSCTMPSPLSVPVDVVGDGEHGVLLHHAIVSAKQGSGCRRATDDDEWHALRRELGHEFASRVASDGDFTTGQFVAVRLPGEAQLVGIVVSSEEGVDVLTLDIKPGDQTTSQACLLRLSRRRCQIAIILRDQNRGEERTLAVYSGL